MAQLKEKVTIDVDVEMTNQAKRFMLMNHRAELIKAVGLFILDVCLGFALLLAVWFLYRELVHYNDVIGARK